MKVLHIISSGGMYGAEAVILNLSRALKDSGHESILGVFSNSAQPNVQLQESAAKAGILVCSIPCRGQVDWAVIEEVRRLVNVMAVDIVHAHGYKADVYVYLAHRGRPIRLISTCHTWYDNDLAVRLYGALDRWVLRSYAGVVAVSQEVKEKLLGAGVRAERIKLVRNGIDFRPFDREKIVVAESDSLRVGMVGRLSPEKGVTVFLRAAALVLAKLPEVSFVVAGDGPDRAMLEELINDLGIMGRVTLAGRIDEMAGFYTSLDLMVSASLQEGLPIALLEGMASRLPIVATSVGEVPTIIRNEETGLLVAPNDVPALAQAIVRMLGDSELRSSFGEAARRLVVEEFSAEHMAAEYLQLYTSALEPAERAKAERYA